jgi:alanine-synthesizing transaminase
MTPFSRRSAYDLDENELTRALARRRARGPVLDLTVSNPTTARLGVPILSDRGRLALSCEDVALYEPLPFGLPDTRAAIAHGYMALGEQVSGDDVICTASTSEAYAWLFSLLADPGDAVFVPVPSYPLFSYLAAYQSVRLLPYPLRYDGAWHVDLPELRTRVSNEPRARAILAVSPNNPTGSTTKADELAAMLALGLPIVSDEVFARYPLGDPNRRFTSAVSARSGLTFTLSGLSKEAALPQMKLGWMALAGDRALVDEAKARLEVLADTFLSVGTPVQRAARVLLEEAPPVREAIVRRTSSNLVLLDSLLADGAITRLHVEGGWYATLRLPSTQDEDTWLHAFLEAGVYVHPASFFDFEDTPFVVVSLLTPPDEMRRGVDILRATVEKSIA